MDKIKRGGVNQFPLNCKLIFGVNFYIFSPLLDMLQKNSLADDFQKNGVLKNIYQVTAF